MEGDKEAYVEETGKALKRQRKNIYELNDEKAELARKLRVTKSRHNRNKDAENAAKIARLAEEQDTLGIMIKREKQNMKVSKSRHEAPRLTKRYIFFFYLSFLGSAKWNKPDWKTNCPTKKISQCWISG